MFESQVDRPNMKEYFRAIDVDPSEAKGLFRLLDMDGSGTINAEEFLNGCLRLRGPAKALDLALVMREMRRMHTQFDAHLNAVEQELIDAKCLPGAMERPWANVVSEGSCGKVLEHGSIAGMIEVDHFHTGSTAALTS